jgi:hypothetical protein
MEATAGPFALAGQLPPLAAAGSSIPSKREPV